MSLMMDEQLYAAVAMQRAEKNMPEIRAIANKVKQANINSIVFVARGTSNHAALYFKYICETLSGIKVSKFFHSEATILGKCCDMKNTLLLSVSQSGASTDTIRVTEMAKTKGAVTVAVTNFTDSPLAKICDYHLHLDCGEEKSVAATKTFTLELAVLTMLAEQLAGVPISDYKGIAAKMAQFSSSYPAIKAVAVKQKDIDNLVVLSRGAMQFLCEELCLKLTETSYKLAKAFSTAEFVHGPIAMLEEGRTAILLAPKGAFDKYYIETATKLRGIGVNLISFTDIDEIKKLSSDYIEMPSDENAAPYLYAMALQCFAVNIAEALGRNPDSPRGLKKVTVTV